MCVNHLVLGLCCAQAVTGRQGIAAHPPFKSPDFYVNQTSGEEEGSPWGQGPRMSWKVSHTVASTQADNPE